MVPRFARDQISWCSWKVYQPIHVRSIDRSRERERERERETILKLVKTKLCKLQDEMTHAFFCGAWSAEKQKIFRNWILIIASLYSIFRISFWSHLTWRSRVWTVRCFFLPMNGSSSYCLAFTCLVNFLNAGLAMTDPLWIFSSPEPKAFLITMCPLSVVYVVVVVNF